MPYGITDSENRLSKPTRIICQILMFLYSGIEGLRTYSMWLNWTKGGLIAPFIFSMLACGFTVLMIVQSLRGNRKAIVLWFFIGVSNLVVTLTSLFRISLDMLEGVVGLPQWLIPAYFLVQIVLAVLLGIYGWSLTKPSAAHEVMARRKGKDFGEFINDRSPN